MQVYKFYLELYILQIYTYLLFQIYYVGFENILQS